MNPVFLFLGNLGAGELTLIALIVLLLFGGSKIPELMRGLGRGVREFNSAKNSVEDEIRQGIRDADQKTPAAGPTDRRTPSDNNYVRDAEPRTPVDNP